MAVRHWNVCLRGQRVSRELDMHRSRPDDGWGYIKQNGDIAVQPQFEDAKAFNSRGIAPVKTDGSWKLIQLDIY